MVREGKAQLVAVEEAPVCYPRPCDVANRLKEVGVEGIFNYGPRDLGGFFALGAGFRGVVFLAKWRGKEVALKVRRSDCACDMREEGRVQKSAWPVAPKVFYYDKDFIIMEYVPYPDVTVLLDMEREELKEKLKEILRAGRELDKRGIDHGELVRPWKHVRVGERVVFLDFGSASTRRKPSNVTSLLSGLLLKPSPPASTLAERLGIERAKLLELAKIYKRKQDDEVFETLLDLLG